MDVASPIIEQPYSDKNEQPLFEQEGVRGVAIRTLLCIESTGMDATRATITELSVHPDWNDYDRVLFQELVWGTLRLQARLDWVLTGFFHGEFPQCLAVVQHSLRVALYQVLMHSKISPQQAIESASRLIERIKGSDYAGRCANILRIIARNVNSIRYPARQETVQYLMVMYSHPHWLVKRWLERYGTELTEQMLAANSERPHLFVASNSTYTSPEKLRHWMQEHTISFHESTLHPRSLRLNSSSEYQTLPIYREGWFYACDPIHLIVAEHVLQNHRGNSVLITGTQLSTAVLPILEQVSLQQCRAVAWTECSTHLKWLFNECHRLKFQTPQIIDALTDSDYTVVWIEAPCSNIGLWRRRPDMKRRADSGCIVRSALRTKNLLNSVVSHVLPGGSIILVVASTEPEETLSIVEWFTQQYPEFTVQPFPSSLAPSLLIMDGMIQTMPHTHLGDSVFVVQFHRTH